MSQPRISLRNTTDLLDVLPTFLGFYPTESLCALYLDNTPAGHRVAVTARTDLPTTPQALASTTEHLIGFLDRYDLVVLVAYSADQQAARDVLTHLIYATDPAQVLTAVTATPQGWAHIDPATPQVRQQTNPYPSGTSAAAAQAVLAGYVVRGTRDDLAETITTPDPNTAQAFHHAYTRQHPHPGPDAAQQAAQEAVERIQQHLTNATAVGVEEAAWLAARIQNIQVRDAACTFIEPDTADQHAALWQAVARHTPDEYAVPVLALLGMAAWIAGNGALANLALERATTLPAARGYTLLGLLEEILARAVPPTLWDAMRHNLP